MQPECFICNNCHLICSIYERALQQGYEARWEPLDNGLYCVEVELISRPEFEVLVDGVKSFVANGGQFTLELAA